MYSSPFFITEPVWNNAFSINERINKKLYVPELKEISSFDEIEIWNEISFEDFDFDWKFSSNVWLRNFYKFTNNTIIKKGINAPIYLFDNHNHAYFFWFKTRSEWIIWDNNILYHIDEHSDINDSWKYLLKPISFYLDKVFNFTNNVLNVWNYIIAAQREWIIWKIVQIRNKTNLESYINWELSFEWNIILNLDLDFFQEELDYIDFNLKKKVILDIAKKASLITVSTSPFFINQGLAIKCFREIFE